MKRAIGLLITSSSLLCLPLVIMMAKIAMYIDKNTKTWDNSLFFYLPNSVFVCISISLLLGLYLIFQRDEKQH